MTRRQPPAFGEQLQRYRVRAGLTQEELAERTALAASTISALERGVRRLPYPDTRRRLGEALGLSAEEQAAFGSPRVKATLARIPARSPIHLPATNLPAQRTPLIGRAREVEALSNLLRHDQARLVTLTGVGGCGKTRLALHVAGQVSDAFPGGVWWVDLAPVADPALVPQAAAAAVGVQEAPGMPIEDTVISRLQSQPLLLVLDNCEHLIDACAGLTDRLLTACPALRILATSREPLQIAGERRWRVSPLAAPDPDRQTSPDQAAQYPAVQLFLARAHAVAPDFALTDANTADVAQVCARLDGIPLALELAAARAGVLSAAQILARLDDSIRLLTGGSRSAPARQQTLRAALDWSYELLTETEQSLFRRLATFAGGFTLEAAEYLGADLPSPSLRANPSPPRGGEPELGADTKTQAPPSLVGKEDGGLGLPVLDLLSRLVDKSFVLAVEAAEAPRFRLLEPVRQYAAWRLANDGETEAERARHAAYYVALAERAALELRGAAQVAWLRDLDLEQDNLRLALRWLETSGNASAGLRLAVALVPYWEARGHLSEGRRWLKTLLALGSADLPAALRSRALVGAGGLAQWQADLDDAETCFEESLTLAREMSDGPGTAESLAWLGTILRRRGAFPAAMELLEESLALYRDLGDAWGIAFALLDLGVTVGNQGDHAQGQTLLEEALPLFRQAGDLRYVAITLTMLGGSMRAQNEPEQAAALLREGLAGHLAVGDRAFVLENLRQFAALAAGPQPAHATRLLGAADALRDLLGVVLAPINRITDDQTIATIRTRLGESEFAAARRAGRALTLEQAVADALAMASPPDPAPLIAGTAPSKLTADPLTRRETEVARLLTLHYTDREIAEVLSISVRTVGVHIQHLLAKLDLRSRWQIADWATTHGLHATTAPRPAAAPPAPTSRH